MDKLERGFAEGIKEQPVQHYMETEHERIHRMIEERFAKHGGKMNADGTTTISSREEWKDIIHLMNVQAKEIAKKAPAELNDSERQYLLMTLEANRNAFCAGLYDRD